METRRWCGLFVAWLIALGGSARAQKTIFTVGGAEPGAYIASAKGIGDLNGDGHAEVAVGLPYGGPSGGGMVRVHSGKNGAVLASWSAGAGELYGWSVGPAGDVDGDGVGDVMAGAPGGGSFATGLARVRSGATGQVLWVAEGGAPGDQFGVSVAGLGDLDLDGFGDFLVGASQAATGAGYASVFTGLSGQVGSIAFGDQPGDEFGAAVANVGDLDLDGWPERLLAAPGSAGDTGSARVLSGESGFEMATLVGSHLGARFGQAAAGGADMSGDGHADFVVGEPAPSSGTAGRVYLFDGATLVLRGTFTGSSANDQAGSAVAVLGDVDSDGLADAFAGAPGDDGAGADAGIAAVVSGKHAGVLATMAGVPGAQLGLLASAAGDVDADGLPDAIAGPGAIRVVSWLPPGLAPYGSGTPGCFGSQTLAANGTAKVGSATFALVCAKGPVSALGLGLLSPAATPTVYDPFGAGVVLHVDLASAGALAFDAVTDVLGATLVPLPIPSSPALAGKTVYGQILWHWKAGPCWPSPQGLSSSRGLAITIQQP